MRPSGNVQSARTGAERHAGARVAITLSRLERQFASAAHSLTVTQGNCRSSRLLNHEEPLVKGPRLCAVNALIQPVCCEGAGTRSCLPSVLTLPSAAISLVQVASSRATSSSFVSKS